MVCCAGNVVVICGMYNTLPLHLAPHHITTATSNTIIPNHIFHVTPSFLLLSLSTSRSTLTLQYRISNRTVSATLCITPLTFHITDVPRNATFHVLHAASVSDHTIYWPHHLCIAPQTALHNIAPHSTCSTSCIIPPQLTVITQFHIARPNTTTFYIPPLNTFRITPPPLTRIAHTLPHFTSRKVRSMPQHTYQSILHHHFPVWETRNYTWSQVMLVCRGAGWKHERRVTSWSCYNFYLHQLGNRVGSPLNQMHRQQLELRRPATAETLGGKRTRRWWSDA